MIDWWFFEDRSMYPWGNIVDFDENQITVEILAKIFR